MTEKEREAHFDKFVAELGALTSKYFDEDGNWSAYSLANSGEGSDYEIHVYVDNL